MTRYPPVADRLCVHSLIDALPQGDASLLDQFLHGLSPEQLELLRYDWEFWARDEQPPPQGDWTIWLFLAGRGAGKTRGGAEWVLAKVRENPPDNNPGGRPTIIHLVAPTEADYRDVMIRGESGILSVAAPWELPRFYPGSRRLEFPNGNYALCFSAEQPERLRGPQCDFAWCDELAAWRQAEMTWDMMSFGLRLGRHPQVIVSTTPRPIPLLRRLLADQNTAVTRGTTYDNRANLAPSFFEKIIKRYEGTRLGRQELNAELLIDNPDALFNIDKIEELRRRIEDVPKFKRTVVAVDPPATSGEDADECGIIVAAMGVNDHGYVLADYTVHGETPHEWAKRVLRAYRIFNCDSIVVEVNQGGEMVKDVIEHANKETHKFPALPIRQIRAFKGKSLRAEPVSLLYEQGKVHHVGTFAKLEDQLVNYTIDSDRNPSPDRMDAVVYAITDLMLREPEPVTIGQMRW